MQHSETLCIGARYRLTEWFFVYDGEDSCSRYRELRAGEEFTVLAELFATLNAVRTNYRIYKIIVQSGDVGYIGCEAAGIYVKAEEAP